MKKPKRHFFSSIIFLIFLFSLSFIGCEQKAKADDNLPPTNSAAKNDSTENTDKKRQPESYDPSKYSAVYDDMAKFFAGVPTDSTGSFAGLFNTNTWKAHAQRFSASWAGLENKRLAPIRKWAETELADISPDTKTLFYPFGGPDFLFAATFFPNFENYVLIGLEPVGQLPDLNTLSPGVLSSYLTSMQGSLRTLVTGGFFKTRDMASDFLPGRVNGTVPVLLIFLAKTNHKVLDIEYIKMDGKGKLSYEKADFGAAKQKTRYDGVMIKFTDKNAKIVKKLYFFSTNLANDGFPKKPEFQEFIRSLKPFASMAKAASYLMHQPAFSGIRDFVVSEANYMVEEDSGIPIRYFKDSDWEKRFYGVYSAPIPLFANHVQKDLQAAYRNKAEVRPLPFGLGYYWEPGRSNLLFAIRKNGK